MKLLCSGMEESNNISRSSIRLVKVNPDKLSDELKLLKNVLKNPDADEINYNATLATTIDAILDKVIMLAGCMKSLSRNQVEATKLRQKHELKIKSLNTSIIDLNDKNYNLECDLIQIDQYQRRNNIEFVGIPSNISQMHLEKHILGIINKMGVMIDGKKVSSYDIVACHRLKKALGSSLANVIVRFVNRKVATDCLKKRKSLINIKNEYI